MPHMLPFKLRCQVMAYTSIQVLAVYGGDLSGGNICFAQHVNAVSVDLIVQQQRSSFALKGVLVKMCCGQGCSFARGAVGAAVRAFMYKALTWQASRAPQYLRPALAWVCLHD